MTISATLEAASTAIKIAVGAAVGGLAVFAAGTLYNVIWENPKIAQEARAGYVTLAEKAASDAKAKEAERQRDAAEASLSDLSAKIEIDAAADRQKEQAHEKEIRDYEIRLDQAGRSCRLDDADIEFLRRP